MKPKLSTNCKVIILFIFSWSISIFHLAAQSQDHLIRAGQYDRIDSYRFLSDSVVRVFGITGLHEESQNGYVFSVDYDLSQPLSEGQFHVIGEGQCFFNYGISELFKINLNDGSTIFGLNPFDCDYSPSGGIVRYNSQGELDWLISFQDLDIYGMIESMVFVDSNTIFVEMGDESIFINRNGQIVSFPVPDEFYRETIETDFGFIGRKENQLELLDSGFNLIASHVVIDLIDINEIRENEYLVRSPFVYFILEQSGQLKSLPVSVQEFDFVWRSDSMNWGIRSSDGSIVQMDSSFLPVFTHDLPPGITASFGVSSKNMVFTGATYSNATKRHLVTFAGNEENIFYTLPQDVGVTQIDIPDTILVEYLNLPFWGGGWVQHFDYLHVEVTNFGADTVRNFTLQSQAISECGFCTYFQKRWEVDSLILSPGSTGQIIIGPYVQDCIYNNLTSFCLTTVAPNEKADGNYLHDEFCEPFEFLISTSQVGKRVSFQVEPNPASQFVRIHLNDEHHQDLHGHLFDTNGRRVASIKFTENQHEFSVSDYPNGLYFLQLVDPSKGSSTVKFVVQH